MSLFTRPPFGTERTSRDTGATGVMQSYEEDDTTYWDNRYREREKEMRDPDDVFFEARDRREEIKEQIRKLQSGLARQQPRRTSPKRKRRKRSRPKQKPAA